MNVSSSQTTQSHSMPSLDESWIIRACERGWLPDALTRIGMRTLMRQRLHDERNANEDAFAAELKASPIAIETQAANTQHYEVPGTFFEAHLGPRMKYSCAYYPRGGETLAQAEEAMLQLYAERSSLQDGQRVLDLGCGWGSLALWMAERYPRSEVVALSNSHGQRAFIEAHAPKNLRVVTGNIVDFEFDLNEAKFDRILSIEMFEHMKNYGALLAKISRWLADDGKLFVHLFAHKQLAYHFAARDSSDWMSRYFFTGGTMPSASLLTHFQDDLRVSRQWWIDGTHYAHTARDWLDSLDASRSQIMPMLRGVYGDAAPVWFQRWRMFYMAVEELFGYRRGSEWGVAHYLFDKEKA
jgi:cyclopropane-fatty-acyl-phospholipid synthase